MQSRCTRFRFGPLQDEAVLKKLNEVALAENLELEEGADKAIVSLSSGDMRKVLNILESCSLAYKKIPVDKIYDVTGRPSPKDIKTIYDCLTNQDFNYAYRSINDLIRIKSLALDDIVRDVHMQVMVTKMPEESKMFIVNRLSEIEYRLAQGSNEKGQTAAVVGGFIEIRSIKA